MKTPKTLDELYELLQDKNVNVTDKVSYSHPKKTKGKVVQLSLGRLWFNLLLPDSYPILVDQPVDKKLANSIITELYDILSPQELSETVTKISEHSFKMSSIHPVTFTKDALLRPDSLIEAKRHLSKDLPPDKFNDMVKDITQDYIDNHIVHTGLGDIMKSKATGKLSPADLAILTVAKGPVMDIEGNISEPITSSLIDGYSGKEYYLAAAEARRGYFIRGTGTAQPGYLARQVVFANANTILSKSEDCKTKKYLELFVRKSMASKLLGRFYLNETTGKLIEITSKEVDNISNKVILLRSPLFCIAKDGICEICYGTLAKNCGTKHLGLLAGGVINKAGVEGYAMKARHQASQVNLKPVDFLKDLITI